MNNETIDLETKITLEVNQLVIELVNIVSSNLEFEFDETETSIHNNGERELNEAKQIDEHLSCLNDFNDDSDDEFHMHKLKCDACESKKSLFWRRVTRKQIVCNICFFSKIYLIAFDDDHLGSERKSTNMDDLMEILGDELGLDDDSSNRKSSSRSKNSTNSRTKKLFPNNSSSLGSRQVKQKFQNLTDQQQINTTRPLTRTTAKATSSFQTQVSTSSSVATTVENQNVEEESCGSSVSENNLNVTLGEQAQNANKTITNANGAAAVRKSARVTKSKFAEINLNNNNTYSQNSNESKKTPKIEQSVNRRTKKFKQETRPPTRHETIISNLNMSNSVYHRGYYLKIGDIVALFDLEDKETVFFAQIRAFLTDQYGQKSAVITWLVPINDKFKVRFAKDFNSENFILGPAEEYPRPLECMEFVCRLEQCTNTAIKKEYINKTIQHGTSMLQHKFTLEDLHLAKFRIIANKTFSNTTALSRTDESQEPLSVNYEIVKN